MENLLIEHNKQITKIVKALEGITELQKELVGLIKSEDNRRTNRLLLN